MRLRRSWNCPVLGWLLQSRHAFDRHLMQTSTHAFLDWDWKRSMETCHMCIIGLWKILDVIAICEGGKTERRCNDIHAWAMASFHFVHVHIFEANRLLRSNWCPVTNIHWPFCNAVFEVQVYASNHLVSYQDHLVLSLIILELQSTCYSSYRYPT